MLLTKTETSKNTYCCSFTLAIIGHINNGKSEKIYILTSHLQRAEYLWIDSVILWRCLLQRLWTLSRTQIL